MKSFKLSCFLLGLALTSSLYCENPKLQGLLLIQYAWDNRSILKASLYQETTSGKVLRHDVSKTSFSQDGNLSLETTAFSSSWEIDTKEFESIWNSLPHPESHSLIREAMKGSDLLTVSFSKRAPGLYVLKSIPRRMHLISAEDILLLDRLFDHCHPRTTDSWDFQEPKVWDIHHTLLKSPRGSATKQIESEFSEYGNILATRDTAFIDIWDTSENPPSHLMTFPNQRVDQMTMSPDGTVLATESRDTDDLNVYDIRSGRILCTLTNEVLKRPIINFALSPQGRWLSYHTSGSVHLVPLFGTPRDIPLQIEGEDVFGGLSLTFSPDARELFVGTASGIAVWDVDGRDAKQRGSWFVPKFSLGFAMTNFTSLRLSPDGNTLAATTDRNGMRVLHLWDIKLRNEIPLPKPMGGYKIAWSRDSQQIATYGPYLQVAHSTVHTVTPARDLKIRSALTPSIAYRKDGETLLLFEGASSTLYEIQLRNPPAPR